MIIGDNRSSVVFIGFHWPRIRGENAWYFLDSIMTAGHFPRPPHIQWFCIGLHRCSPLSGIIFTSETCSFLVDSWKLNYFPFCGVWIDDLARGYYSQGQFLFIKFRRNVILGERACPALTDCLMVMVCRRLLRSLGVALEGVVFCTVDCLLRVRYEVVKYWDYIWNNDVNNWQDDVHIHERREVLVHHLTFLKGKPKLRRARIFFAGLDCQLNLVECLYLILFLFFYLVLSTRYYFYCLD